MYIDQGLSNTENSHCSWEKMLRGKGRGAYIAGILDLSQEVVMVGVCTDYCSCIYLSLAALKNHGSAASAPV